MSNTGPALPGGIHNNPDCGACHQELVYDDGAFTCAGCKLDYDGEDPEKPACYSDDTEQPCGHPSPDPAYEKHMPARHGSYVGGIHRFTSDPCSLPASHTGDHWHNTGCERLSTDLASHD